MISIPLIVSKLTTVHACGVDDDACSAPILFLARVTSNKRYRVISGERRRTAVRLAHSPALCAAYPPGSNRFGESHWPLLRVLVAHDLHTGLGMRPQWGPMHGKHAVSEQGLLEVALDRLPSGSIVAGDANFGVFSVAYAAIQRGHPVLLRMTLARAQRLAGELLRNGIDRHVVWKPSRADRKSHPDLPADSCVSGRLIVRQVQPGQRCHAFPSGLVYNPVSGSGRGPAALWTALERGDGSAHPERNTPTGTTELHHT
jgi:hypothetical protein